MRGEPADAQAGHREGLGHHPERHASWTRLGAGRDPTRVIELEEPVDLVDEQVDTAILECGGQLGPLRVIRQHPRGVVWRIDDHELRRRRHGREQARHVERPAIGFAELVERDIGAGRSRDLVQALIPGPADHRVVARSEQDVGETEDGLLGTREHQDLVGFDGVVERGDLASEEWVSGRFRVAECQAVPHGTSLGVSHREQVGHRHPLHVGGTQEVVDREFPSGEVAFEREVGDAHGTHDGAPFG